jgi:hypothetical protein
LFAHGRWFSPASSTTKTGRHDIAEILLKVVLNTKKSINHPKCTSTHPKDHSCEVSMQSDHKKSPLDSIVTNLGPQNKPKRSPSAKFQTFMYKVS